MIHRDTQASVFYCVCCVYRFSHLEEKSSAAARVTSIYASFERKDSDSSKPRVRDLKSFYEKLTEQTEEEVMRERRQSRGAGLKRSKSRVSYVQLVLGCRHACVWC